MKCVMSKHLQQEPWYKNPFMTVFVVGLPVLVVAVCIFFIVWSIRIQDSTVRDDWYMDGKTLYQDATRDKLAHDLGVFGVMRFDGEAVRFELNYPKNTLDTGTLRDGTPLTYPKSLAVSISHATDSSKDRDFTIKHIGENVYAGKVSLDATDAKYYLQVSNDGIHNWRLRHAQKLPAQNVVLSPLSSFDEGASTLPDQRDKRADLSDHPR
ncbi:FixH family protein [Moraxella nasibovis]|uniref:FixH family protein n=1 Tax=Moraxella nasibovis TaxID=2904120 RepID=UPI00351E8ED6